MAVPSGLRRRLAGWQAWLVVVLLLAVGTALAVIAAYRVRPPLAIVVGNEASDKGLVRDFYANEKRPDGKEFRWTRGYSSVVLPAWGRGPYLLAIEMAAPLNPEPSVRILVNGREALATQLGADFQRYEVAVPAERPDDGDLTIAIESKTFSPPGDRRRLGVVVHAVEVLPQPGQGEPAPVRAVAIAVAFVLLLSLTLAAAGHSPLGVGLGGVASALALAALLVWQRPLVVPVIAMLPGIGGAALVLVLVVRGLLAALARWVGWRLAAGETAALLTLLAAALVIRLAAVLHPQIDIIDLGFHVNRLSDVVDRGQLFLTIRSAEWGGRETVYSPAVYLAMAPFLPLVGDKHQLVRLFTVAMETSRLLLIFALARAVAGGHTATIAVLLASWLPIAILPFSWGITSNLFGEWFSTAALLALVLGWRTLQRPVVFVGVVLLAAVALLSHPGVLLLTGGWLGCLVALTALGWLWCRLRGGVADGGRVALLVGIAVLAGALAFGLFYRVGVPSMLQQGGASLAERVGGQPSGQAERRWRVSGSVDDKSLGMGARYVTDPRQLPSEGGLGFAREAWAYYWAWPVLLAPVGFLLLGGRPRGAAARYALGAWILSVITYALVGLTMNLYVRYSLFALPVVSTLAGVCLDRLLATRRAPVVTVVWGLLATTVAAGLWFWYQRVVVFFH